MNNILLHGTFCLPFNGDLEVTKSLIQNIGDCIYEFYGSDDLFRSGRLHSSYTGHFEESVQYILSHGKRFNYLLNSVIMDDYIIRKNELIKHLDYLKELGVQSVTTSSPYFISLLKERGFEISTSLMQFIDTEESVRYAQKLGYHRIILHEDSLKNIPKIEYLRSITSLPIEIIVNNGCLLNCPFRMTHCNCDGLSHPDFSVEMYQQLSSYAKQCKSFWGKNIEYFLKSSWVRPEELEKYRNLGINYFKFTGRTRPSEDNLKIFSIYAAGEHSGYVFDYLKPNHDPVHKYNVKNIHNKDLDAFFDFFFKNSHGCNMKCSICKHCENWANKINKEL